MVEYSKSQTFSTIYVHNHRGCVNSKEVIIVHILGMGNGLIDKDLFDMCIGYLGIYYMYVYLICNFNFKGAVQVKL